LCPEPFVNYISEDSLSYQHVFSINAKDMTAIPIGLQKAVIWYAKNSLAIKKKRGQVN